MLKIKEIHPLFSRIATTADRFDPVAAAEDCGIVVDPRMALGGLNDLQRVVYVGTSVRDFAPGDVVKLSFKRYARVAHADGGLEGSTVTDRMRYEYDIPSVEVGGRELLLVDAADVVWYMKPGDYETDGGGLLQ